MDAEKQRLYTQDEAMNQCVSLKVELESAKEDVVSLKKCSVELDDTFWLPDNSQEEERSLITSPSCMITPPTPGRASSQLCQSQEVVMDTYACYLGTGTFSHVTSHD